MSDPTDRGEYEALWMHIYSLATAKGYDFFLYPIVDKDPYILKELATGKTYSYKDLWATEIGLRKLIGLEK